MNSDRERPAETLLKVLRRLDHRPEGYGPDMFVCERCEESLVDEALLKRVALRGDSAVGAWVSDLPVCRGKPLYRRIPGAPWFEYGAAR